MKLGPRKGNPFASRTLTETAALMGLNREQARNLEQQAFRKLAEGLRDAILKEPALRDEYGHLVEDWKPEDVQIDDDE